MNNLHKTRARRFLSHSEARTTYNKIGTHQDSQGFYENRAIEDMLENIVWNEVDSVVEFGCGTGKLAASLMAEKLPSNACYLGLDISETMIELARQKLAPFKNRCRLLVTDGTLKFGVEDAGADVVISCYVLDLLSPAERNQFEKETHRILRDGGRVGLVSLTFGATLFSGMVTGIWQAVHRVNPRWVGGCYPVLLEDCFPDDRWRFVHKNVITAWGVSSEILVAEKIRGH